MRILALITARGSSKRIPGKNIRPLGGKPLIVWSIDAAKGIPDICDILVSTDDAEIAKVCKAAGANVPWLRPAELATDTASSVDVALHALDWYEAEKGSVDGLLLLQPTSPFRTRESILRGIHIFHENGQRAVVGFSEVKSHPMRCFYLNGDTMSPFIEGEGVNLRSQDLALAYEINGAFYLIAPNEFREGRSFNKVNMMPLIIIDPKESIDIDTEWDWKIAEAALL
jgi:CMP-N,N'-diacetyllegionaminic acid synthase